MQRIYACPKFCAKKLKLKLYCPEICGETEWNQDFPIQNSTFNFTKDHYAEVQRS